MAKECTKLLEIPQIELRVSHSKIFDSFGKKKFQLPNVGIVSYPQPKLQGNQSNSLFTLTQIEFLSDFFSDFDRLIAGCLMNHVSLWLS